MKILALMPVKNEAWILEKTLKTLSCFCDLIIVADQNSTDGTKEILSKFPKVKVIPNQLEGLNSLVRVKLLEAAREYEGNNFLILTDADEIYSSNILEPNVLDRFTSHDPGVLIQLPFVNLWRSPNLYRNDNSVWSTFILNGAFKDDRKVNYGLFANSNDHNGRVPLLGKSIIFKELTVIHFQFILFERMLAKQRWYRMREVIEKGRDDHKRINKYYVCTTDERNIQLTTVNSSWFIGWQNMGIRFDDFKNDDFTWYDIESLEYFQKYGSDYFSNTDIWDVDWESKRKAAAKNNCQNIPKSKVEDPRNLQQKVYHFYLKKYYELPPWQDYKEIKNIFVRYLKKVLKRIGVTRTHSGYIKKLFSLEQK